MEAANRSALVPKWWCSRAGSTPARVAMARVVERVVPALPELLGRRRQDALPGVRLTLARAAASTAYDRRRSASSTARSPDQSRQAGAGPGRSVVIMDYPLDPPWRRRRDAARPARSPIPTAGWRIPTIRRRWTGSSDRTRSPRPISPSLPERPWFVAHDDGGAAPTRGPGCRSAAAVATSSSRNDGHTDQDIWYVADSLAELRAGGRVLVDPNRLSADGRASLQSLTISDSTAGTPPSV